jgi:hypothetical protein
VLLAAKNPLVDFKSVINVLRENVFHTRMMTADCARKVEGALPKARAAAKPVPLHLKNLAV